MNEWKDRVAVKGDRGRLYPAQVQDGGKPVCSGDDLIPDLPLGKLPGIADDGGNPQASLVVGPLGSTPLTGISAASKSVVVVPLFQATLMVLSDAGSILGGVPVVAHEDHNGVFAELVFLKLVEDLQHAVIGCRNHPGIGLSGHGQVPVAGLKLPVVLFRVMRNVEGHVEKEWFLLVLFDVVHGSLGHEVREIGEAFEDLDVVLVEIMKALPVQEKVVVVVDEPTEVSEMVVKALGEGAVTLSGAEVPFPKNGSGVARFPENLGDGDLRSRHVAVLPVAALTISLGPVHNAGALGMTPSHEQRPRRTTDRMAVGLSEADACLRKAIDGRGVEVFRSVAVRVQGPLVIGEKDHHIGRSREGRGSKEEGE